MHLDIIKCDICGEMHEPYGGPGESENPLDRVNTLAFKHVSGRLSITMKEYDICPDCKHVIIRFIKDMQDSLKPVSTDELVRQGWDIDKVGFEKIGDSREKQLL